MGKDVRRPVLVLGKRLAAGKGSVSSLRLSGPAKTAGPPKIAYVMWCFVAGEGERLCTRCSPLVLSTWRPALEFDLPGLRPVPPGCLDRGSTFALYILYRARRGRNRRVVVSMLTAERPGNEHRLRSPSCYGDLHFTASEIDAVLRASVLYQATLTSWEAPAIGPRSISR